MSQTSRKSTADLYVDNQTVEITAKNLIVLDL